MTLDAVLLVAPVGLVIAAVIGLAVMALDEALLFVELTDDWRLRPRRLLRPRRRARGQRDRTRRRAQEIGRASRGFALAQRLCAECHAIQKETARFPNANAP
jgi:hypothetical protein